MESCTGRACPRVALSNTSMKRASKDSETTRRPNRWHFLKQLPHRLLRDIGFAILSPPILLDSQELPLVSPDGLGGGIKTWLDTAKWLATLEVDQVEQWFGGKSNNGRLGEHFAFCVEYALLFSPFAECKNLMTYQQVTHKIAHGLRSQATETTKEVCEHFNVGLEEGDVLIRLNNGYGCTSSELPMSVTMDTSEDDVVAACDHLEKLTAQDEGEKIGKRKRKLLRKMQRLKDGHGATVTVGEFDFLFEQDCQVHHIRFEEKGAAQLEETVISHWEVSVKFLLYAGPWEVLGFETPCHAAWKCANQVSQEEQSACQEELERQQQTNTCRSGEFEGVKKDDWHADSFFGCFLGPHVGETLYNRKTRLINQLMLSQNIHAASLLCKLFGSTPCEESKAPLINHSPCRTPSIMSDTRHHAQVLRVCPRAFLKGYLFYEHDLWYRLRSEEQLNSLDTRLDPNHWMGWWTRARDFVGFAKLPIHAHSKWYIVPKLEWLSPVVIDRADKDRIQHVSSLDEFLIIAAKVAEEAERLNIPRKRRFLVAEVSWESMATSYRACKQTADREEPSKGCGKWTEVSRGFVVEDTWPDTRLYEPHGYRMSQLHS